MKLDILKNSWLDIVFEGRNKSYGAYELRKTNPRTTLIALLIGALIFVFAISTPKIMSLLKSEKVDKEEVLDQKIVTIKLPPKEEPVIENLPPPPPPPPREDQVKFVKPVVAKTEEIVEDPPKIVDLKDKKVGDENLKGDPDAPISLGPVGDGPVREVVEDDTQIYNVAGIAVKPDFPGGIQKFYSYVKKNFRTPDIDGLKGKVFVTFVVEKDGSLTDIKVLRDIGYGTDKEAIRLLKNSPKWTPGEQNGKKIRVLYSLPITISAN